MVVLQGFPRCSALGVVAVAREDDETKEMPLPVKKLSKVRLAVLKKEAQLQGGGTTCLPGDELEAIISELEDLRFRMEGLEK